MNIALWILQALLAFVFLAHAYGMMRPDRERLSRSRMKYVVEMPSALRLFAAISEGLAAIALVVPPLLPGSSWLTPLAAAGLVVLMLGAMVLHVLRTEYPNLTLNAVLLVLAAAVAWGRFGPYPF